MKNKDHIPKKVTPPSNPRDRILETIGHFPRQPGGSPDHRRAHEHCAIAREFILQVTDPEHLRELAGQDRFDVLSKWIWEGRDVLVYENWDLGSPDLGKILYVSSDHGRSALPNPLEGDVDRRHYWLIGRVEGRKPDATEEWRPPSSTSQDL